MKNCQFFLSSGLVSFFKSINFISRFYGQTSGIKFRFFSFFPNFSLAIRLRVGIDDPSQSFLEKEWRFDRNRIIKSIASYGARIELLLLE